MDSMAALGHDLLAASAGKAQQGALLGLPHLVERCYQIGWEVDWGLVEPLSREDTKRYVAHIGGGSKLGQRCAIVDRLGASDPCAGKLVSIDLQ